MLKHAVEFAGDGMPAVVSTPHLVGFLERTARQTLAPHLEADERSVGIELDLRHLAPTPVGQTIHCTARVIAVEGARSRSKSRPATTHEVIVRGVHKRAVIRLESFSRRVQAKMG